MNSVSGSTRYGRRWYSEVRLGIGVMNSLIPNYASIPCCRFCPLDDLCSDLVPKITSQVEEPGLSPPLASNTC